MLQIHKDKYDAVNKQYLEARGIKFKGNGKGATEQIS